MWRACTKQTYEVSKTMYTLRCRYVRGANKCEIIYACYIKNYEHIFQSSKNIITDLMAMTGCMATRVSEKEEDFRRKHALFGLPAASLPIVLVIHCVHRFVISLISFYVVSLFLLLLWSHVCQFAGRMSLSVSTLSACYYLHCFVGAMVSVMANC